MQESWRETREKGGKEGWEKGGRGGDGVYTMNHGALFHGQSFTLLQHSGVLLVHHVSKYAGILGAPPRGRDGASLCKNLGRLFRGCARHLGRVGASGDSRQVPDGHLVASLELVSEPKIQVVFRGRADVSCLRGPPPKFLLSGVCGVLDKAHGTGLITSSHRNPGPQGPIRFFRNKSTCVSPQCLLDKRNAFITRTNMYTYD